MLPKKFRLGKEIRSRKFKILFSSPLFMLKYAAHDGGHNRFGIIISNRAVGKSTKRHFFKRFFLNRAGLWPELGGDFLFIASPAIGSAAKTILEQKIDEARKTAEKKLSTS